MFARRMGPAVGALAMLLPAAAGQTVLHELQGSPGSYFGGAVAGAGDVDADGVPDVIVGAVHERLGSSLHGSAYVYSGATGAELHRFYGDGFFGGTVDGAGDLDGDGHADLLVGALQHEVAGVQVGAVYVYSGATGGLLYELLGTPGTTNVGTDVADAGDVDGDGVDDVISGAWTAGRARVWSGATGKVLRTFVGQKPSDHFGIAVAGLGDVDGDGLSDLAVGAWLADHPAKDDTGAAYVYSGGTGALLYTVFGEGADDNLGTVLDGAGDVDGDGVPDLIVGARANDAGGDHAGRAYVLGGADGKTIHVFQGTAGEWLGGHVAGAGDVDGDGVADLLVGASGAFGGAGAVRLFSGGTGALLHEIRGDDPGDYQGVGDGLGDLDGDGFAEWTVGASHDADLGPNSGLLRIYTGRIPAAVAVCSPAVPNSTGLPGAIHAHGSDVLAQGHLWLFANQLPAHFPGLFLVAPTTGFVANPGGSQGNLCLGGAIGRYVDQLQSTGATGWLGLEADLAAFPPNGQVPQVGETWSFQAWYRDQNPGATTNFTDAVSVTWL